MPLFHTADCARMCALSLFALITWGVPTSVAAQDEPCDARGEQAFEESLRTRSAIDDVEAGLDQMRFDLDALDWANDELDREEAHIRVFGGPLVHLRYYGLVGSCTTRGEDEGDLMRIRGGGYAGVDSPRYDMRLSYLFLSSTDTLRGPSFTPSAPQADALPLQASSQIQMHTLSLKLTSWFALSAGLVDQGPVEITDEHPEVDFADRARTPGTDPRLFFIVGVPRLDISLALLSEDRANLLETTYLNLEPLPLGGSSWHLGGRIGRFADQDLNFATATVEWITHFEDQNTFEIPVKSASGERDVSRQFQSLHREIYVGLDTSMESGGETLPRLRFARARTGISVRQATKQLDQLSDAVMGGFYYFGALDAGFSIYHSRPMEERTGVAWAPGAQAHAQVGIGLRLMSN